MDHFRTKTKQRTKTNIQAIGPEILYCFRITYCRRSNFLQKSLIKAKIYRSIRIPHNLLDFSQKWQKKTNIIFMSFFNVSDQNQAKYGVF